MKLRRVELFASNELDYLEDQMNNWMETNPEAHIIDVRFSGNGTTEKVDTEPIFEIIYTAVIFYEKVKE